MHQGAGVLHKAYSVFVFRKAGAEVLLQQRSPRKKLFPLRWANTCCSHASPADELLVTAAERRLQEEFGFTLPLREAGSFVYRATDPDNALTEYEHDTVLIGSARGVLSLKPDPTEIADWRWMRVAALERDLRDNPARYAPWLPAALRVSLRDSRARSST